MDTRLPSSFTRVRELIEHLRICSQLDSEMTNILEDVYKHLYGIEENYKRLLETSRKHDSQLASLEKRYSELMYVLRDIKRCSD